MKHVFRAGMLLAMLGAGMSPLRASTLDADPPADAANPPSMVEIAVPSHGAQLLGVLYTAGGKGPHSAVIIYHGFPGYEQNLDLAQALRRAGYNVLAVHYRGSWGVDGTFSFQHAIEDVDAQVEWIRSAPVAAKYHVEPSRVIVIGHSLGGYLALSAAAHHPAVAAAVAISGADLGRRFAGLTPEDRARSVAQDVAHRDPVDLLPLKGTSAEALSGEIFDHRDEWNFQKFAPALGKRPVLLITARDGTGPSSEALLQVLKGAGNNRSEHIEVETDHPFSDHRITLEQRILEWLQRQGLDRPER